jgi:hypothetical protein
VVVAVGKVAVLIIGLALEGRPPGDPGPNVPSVAAPSGPAPRARGPGPVRPSVAPGGGQQVNPAPPTPIEPRVPIPSPPRPALPSIGVPIP